MTEKQPNDGERNQDSRPVRIICVGASAGGLNALTELVASFQGDLPAAVFIVLHLSRTSLGDFLLMRLQPVTSFRCKIAAEGQAVEAGNIYIAPPDRHLLVKDDRIRLGRGPAENRWRPSIDVLFRSIATAYGGRAVGVILTGLLDDGTAGMLAIRKCGGICLVQDPNEAEFPDMPLNVLNLMEVDHCLPLAELGLQLIDIVLHVPAGTASIPPQIAAEAEIAEKVAIGLDIVSNLGEGSVFACPDCGGGLWEIAENGTRRYRCHIGHAYTEKILSDKQSEALEGTLWIAVRMMEERRNLMLKMADNYKKKGLTRLATERVEISVEIAIHIDRLKEVLFATQESPPGPSIKGERPNMLKSD